jgi:N-acetylneuraminic acid mutarotase
MKNLHNFLAAVIPMVILTFCTQLLLSQTPQYYNYNNGTSSNSFPFNVSGGKATNYLFLAGEFNQPTPIPSGQQITKVYFRTSGTANATYTTLHILFAQDVITTLTTGTFYPGPWDTVYYHASVPLTSTPGGWMGIQLDHPYPYDPAKSLIIFVGQCGYTGTGTTIYNSMTTGIRRVWSVGGCPLVPYASGDASTLNFGVDVEPAVPSTIFYFTQWCPTATLPNLPTGTFYNAVAWLGDTLYSQTPSSAGVAATTVYRYTWGGTWTTGVPLPVAKEGGTLTACGGKLYYIGGSSSVATGSTDCYEYTPSTGTWVLKAPMPAALSGHGTVAWGDSVLFVISGNWAAPSTSCYAYRPASNTWITTSPAPFGRRSHAVGISGNVVFMAAGYNGGYKKEFAIGTIGSDASTITWVTGPSIPVSYNGISRTGGTAYGDKFYVVAGEREVGLYSDETWVWNITGGTWTLLSGKPTAVSNNFTGVTSKLFVDSLRVFCVGGYNGSAGVANFEEIGCGPVVVGTPGKNTIPLAYKLYQNYPNPFNPVTKITFALPKTENVKLTVYDMLGREVAVLVNEKINAGTFDVQFNGTNIASGVYFYRLDAGSFTDVKKMTLIK